MQQRRCSKQEIQIYATYSQKVFNLETQIKCRLANGQKSGGKQPKKYLLFILKGWAMICRRNWLRKKAGKGNNMRYALE